METNPKTERTKLSIWIQALRPFSYTATIIPVLLGAMLVFTFYQGKVDWYLMFIIGILTPLFQISGNLLSEYYDFIHKVDRPETLGSSRVLVEGLMKPQTIRNAGYISLTLLAVLGMALVYFRGLNLLYIGLVGLLGSYIYSIAKRKAMGDFLIFLCFGPFMVLGTFYALTGTFDTYINLALISLPVAFLVTAILHANNTRDITFDTQAHIKTLASVLGLQGAKFEYYFLVVGSYLAVVLYVIFGLLKPWSLLILLSLPPAIKNLRQMYSAKAENPQGIAMLDVLTAQHHMLFGLLYCLSILISKFI